jgi:cytochrome c oxidase assembly protein subunit 15
VVLASAALLLVLLWVLWRANAPAVVQRSGQVLLAVMVAQGFIGYTQFFTHLPAVLVGIHVFGASMVWATVLWFHHGLSEHQPESAEPSGRRDDPADRRFVVTRSAPAPAPTPTLREPV